MYTPIPSHETSPDFVKLDQDDDTSTGPSQQGHPPPNAIKSTISRRMKWTALLVPLTLILIALSLRYITHPHALDLLSTDLWPESSWRNWTSCLSDWRPHARHRRRSPPSSSISFPGSPTSTVASTSSSAAPQSLPTIPSSPPVLPTPFPRPFDTSFTQNFSSTDCYSFFINMTSDSSFLSCRPFSLLLQSSQAFIQQAQNNISLLNSVVWGTCNAKIPPDQCITNMAGFTSTLESLCKADLSAKNAVVVNTLEALKAFPLMATAGCLPDISTNAYCYVEAVYNPNPSDVYFYQLPLGIQLPNSTSPSCSACTKTLMGLFAMALGNETKGTLTGLELTYAGAAQLAIAKCGEGYASTQVANIGGAVRFGSSVVLALMSVIGLTVLSGLP